MELDGAERQVLTALCDALFPGAQSGSDFYRRSAHDMGLDAQLADAVEHSLQPGNADDFRRFLSVVDSPLYNLVLSGNPVRFTSIGPGERAR